MSPSAVQNMARHNRPLTLCIVHNLLLFLFQVTIIIPIAFFVTCSFLVLMPFYVEPVVIGMGVLITLLGIPVYLIGVRWKNKPKSFQNLMGKFISSNCQRNDALDHLSLTKVSCLNIYLSSPNHRAGKFFANKIFICLQGYILSLEQSSPNKCCNWYL